MYYCGMGIFVTSWNGETKTILIKLKLPVMLEHLQELG